MKKTIIAIIIVAVLVLAGGYFVLKPTPAVPLSDEDAAVCGLGEGCTISDKRVQGFNVGNQVPNLELKTFDGETEYLYEMLKGKDKFILSLAVDWCPDCERQDEKLNEYYKDLPDNYGAAVVFVDYSSSDGVRTTNKEQAQNYVGEKDYVFPTFWDEGNVIATDFGGVLATPTNIILDENAVIKGKTEEVDMDILFNTNDAEYNPQILEERKE
ncbi:redoxin domain-containing protein [Mollicutes bacterium LVI A0078]|nr:redoxin domain-containing protein [Mollicutes bacterium LVI A0075]WOO91158.1 redoxin domain-containing protein [Mollicutes bacterium LVI A0078]